MQTITRDDLAYILVEKMGLKKTHAREFVDAFFHAIIESIAQGNRIEVRGFGVFEVSKTDPRPNARNPKTGEQVFVPKRRKVMFKPGKVLREELSKAVEIEE